MAKLISIGPMRQQLDRSPLYRSPTRGRQLLRVASTCCARPNRRGAYSSRGAHCFVSGADRCCAQSASDASQHFARGHRTRNRAHSRSCVRSHPDGSRRRFMVKIDRGTMPVSRSDLRQTSFQRKMHAYLTAYAANLHETRFGWKAYRVLTVTTDDQRMRSMQESLRQLSVPNTPGPALFFFVLRDQLSASDPLAHAWQDGTGREIKLM
jgi:hypothetical protein